MFIAENQTFEILKEIENIQSTIDRHCIDLLRLRISRRLAEREHMKHYGLADCLKTIKLVAEYLEVYGHFQEEYRCEPKTLNANNE